MKSSKSKITRTPSQPRTPTRTPSQPHIPTRTLSQPHTPTRTPSQLRTPTKISSQPHPLTLSASRPYTCPRRIKGLSSHLELVVGKKITTTMSPLCHDTAAQSSFGFPVKRQLNITSEHVLEELLHSDSSEDETTPADDETTPTDDETMPTKTKNTFTKDETTPTGKENTPTRRQTRQTKPALLKSPSPRKQATPIQRRIVTRSTKKKPAAKANKESICDGDYPKLQSHNKRAASLEVLLLSDFDEAMPTKIQTTPIKDKDTSAQRSTRSTRKKPVPVDIPSDRENIFPKPCSKRKQVFDETIPSCIETTPTSNQATPSKRKINTRSASSRKKLVVKSSHEDIFSPPLLVFKGSKRKRSKSFEPEDCESDYSDFKETENFNTPKKRSRKRPASQTTPPCAMPTPKRPKKTPRVVTPSVPQRKKLGPKSKNHFELAKERLHVSAVPDSLPCREDEFATIMSFVEGKLLDGTGGCMYISGVPGTGKTATINEIARSLREAASEGQVPSFNFVELNGLRLTEPHQAYVTILKALTGQKATPDHAANLLDVYFSKPHPTPTLLLADELDLLWTRRQTVLYNLFDWPSRLSARLIVLAVANTMDLPERIMKNKVSSRLGLTRLTFQPYTFRQLQEIVTSRMSGLKVFEPDAIQLAARKVAAVSGDARRALDICRRAASRAGSGCGQREKGRSLVGMAEVEAVVKEMYSAAKIQAIKHASMYEKLFLRALLTELARTGLEEAPLTHITHQLHTLCQVEGVRSIGHTQLSLLCSRLCSCRLLLMDTRRRWESKIRLNISTDDLTFALKE